MLDEANQVVDTSKIIIEVERFDTVAIRSAIQILDDQLRANRETKARERTLKYPAGTRPFDPNLTLWELDHVPLKARNCLIADNYTKIGKILATPRATLLRVKNLHSRDLRALDEYFWREFGKLLLP